MFDQARVRTQMIRHEIIRTPIPKTYLSFLLNQSWIQTQMNRHVFIKMNRHVFITMWTGMSSFFLPLTKSWQILYSWSQQNDKNEITPGYEIPQANLQPSVTGKTGDIVSLGPKECPSGITCVIRPSWISKPTCLGVNPQSCRHNSYLCPN